MPRTDTAGAGTRAGSRDGAEAGYRLPPVLRGRRRGWLVQLVLLGLLQAGLAALSAWALVRLQDAPVGMSPVLVRAVVVLVLAALAAGAARVQERVAAERLGQDYVHEIRLRLLEDALTPGDPTSLGVTVARTTNDLSSVRNWVSQGIAPLVSAVPMLLGCTAALMVLSPPLAAALVLPIVTLVALLVPWSRTALARTREVRRRRGRLAALVADTVTASDGVVAARGERRELRGIDKVATTMIDRSVDRAESVGLIRAGAMVAATATTMLVAATGIGLGLTPGVTMAAMVVAGMASVPVLELGRIVEFRQTYEAARLVLAPALSRASARREAMAERRQRSAEQVASPSLGEGVHLHLPGLTDADGPLVAAPGEVLRLVDDGDRGAARELMRRVLDLQHADHPEPDSVWVDGENLRAVPVRRARELVGHAAAGTVFERGTVERALHYRRPDLDGARDEEVLDAVGLDLASLPEGGRTRLRAGGAALDRSDRARLALGRAVYGDTPLVLVDGLEGDLDAEGREMLGRVLAAHPGVVLLTGSDALAEKVGAREVRVSRTRGPVDQDGADDADVADVADVAEDA